MQESAYSRLAFEMPEERAVRQACANFLGIPLEQLTSTVRDPNQRRDGNRTIANSNRMKLPEPIMKGIIAGAYGNQRPELVIPKIELVTPKQGKNKGIQRVEPVRDPASNALDQLIAYDRPGSTEVLERFGLRI